MYHTRQILAYLNKYQDSMSLEQKIRFFLDYYEMDKDAWDADFGNMDFFFERITKKRRYIFNSIYKPILDFNNAVANHVWHFRWHLDGSGKNECVMRDFISELEIFLLKKTEQDIPTQYDENGQPCSFCHYSYIEPKLVHTIQEELSGRYYEILYGRRAAKKAILQEENANGQT